MNRFLFVRYGFHESRLSVADTNLCLLGRGLVSLWLRLTGVELIHLRLGQRRFLSSTPKFHASGLLPLYLGHVTPGKLHVSL